MCSPQIYVLGELKISLNNLPSISDNYFKLPIYKARISLEILDKKVILYLKEVGHMSQGSIFLDNKIIQEAL
jgi:hypothetical protein